MRTFSTYGPVNPTDHYVVSRAEELADFIKRVKLGRYIVIFAPRQTGKTTFFQWALDALAADAEEAYFPIEVNFEVYERLYRLRFLRFTLRNDSRGDSVRLQGARCAILSEDLNQFLEGHRVNRSRRNAQNSSNEFGAFLGR